MCASALRSAPTPTTRATRLTTCALRPCPCRAEAESPTLDCFSFPSPPPFFFLFHDAHRDPGATLRCLQHFSFLFFFLLLPSLPITLSVGTRPCEVLVAGPGELFSAPFPTRAAALLVISLPSLVED